jgi:voltage-gated potassium channel
MSRTSQYVYGVPFQKRHLRSLLTENKKNQHTEGKISYNPAPNTAPTDFARSRIPVSPSTSKFRFLVTLFVAIALFGTAGFMLIEHLSFMDAFYFTLVTIATVGYGDIHPTTPFAKGFVIILIVFGVGTFGAILASATELLVNRRENEIRKQKLNMVTGLFFSELGNKLMLSFCSMDPRIEAVRNDLLFTNDWSDEDFSKVAYRLRAHSFDVAVQSVSLKALRNVLEAKGALLLRLLENPILLERESFTELLRAVFHLRDELLHRNDFETLPDTDLAHLAGDIKRAYGLLVLEWLGYLGYLKKRYPYLFSLALRTNPFKLDQSAVVK